MKGRHANLITDKKQCITHAILAPDTAMLKAVCFFPTPFENPLISGLNFLSISDVRIEGIKAKEKMFCYSPNLPSSGVNMNYLTTQNR